MRNCPLLDLSREPSTAEEALLAPGCYLCAHILPFNCTQLITTGPPYKSQADAEKAQERQLHVAAQRAMCGKAMNVQRVYDVYPATWWADAYTPGRQLTFLEAADK